MWARPGRACSGGDKPSRPGCRERVPLGVYSLLVFIFLKAGRSLEVLICAEKPANDCSVSAHTDFSAPLVPPNAS